MLISHATTADFQTGVALREAFRVTMNSEFIYQWNFPIVTEDLVDFQFANMI